MHNSHAVKSENIEIICILVITTISLLVIASRFFSEWLGGVVIDSFEWIKKGK